MRKNLVLHEAVELPLDGFLFFWGLALFPQWNVLLRRVDELFKTWASRITARAAPGEASGICPEYGAVSGGARMRGRASGTEERRTWVYEKNSRRPCGAHGQKEFCTENKKEQTRKKQKFFGKIFVLNNYGIFLGK